MVRKFEDILIWRRKCQNQGKRMYNITKLQLEEVFNFGNGKCSVDIHLK